MSIPPSDQAEGIPSNTKTNSICQVCGDSASIFNYGVLTCISCRTFFRRNGFHKNKVCLKKNDQLKSLYLSFYI